MLSNKNLVRRPQNVQEIDRDLRAIVEVNIEKKKLEEENKALKNKTTHLNRALKEGDNDRAIYMEGASWMANKCNNQCFQ